MEFSPMFEYDLDHIFKYHSPTPEQQEQYLKIREAGKAFAQVLIENSPFCSSDLTHALNCVREAVMFANANIALDGRIKKTCPLTPIDISSAHSRPRHDD